MKTCKTCGQVKPLTEYYKANKGTSLFPECKDCNRSRARLWNRSRRAEDPMYSTSMRLKHLYNLTLENYEAMLAQQGGGCAICGALEVGDGKGGRFHVDHDHATGEVRGLLCQGCNTGIGNLGEDVDRLMAAAAYLLTRRNVLGEVKF